MNTVQPAVPHLPAPILELVCNQLAADVSRLSRILAEIRPSRLSEIVSAAAHAAPTNDLLACPIIPKFTPYDPAWDVQRKAALEKRFTGYKNFCPDCVEMVVNGNSVLRKTKGVYLPIKHECPKVREVEGVPSVKERVVNKSPKFRSEKGAQEHFEKHSVVFVGDGAELEVIDSFKYSPRMNHSDQREKDLLMQAQRRSRIGIAVGPACLRCGAPITKRKGTKYCSKNCCNRHGEETRNQGEQ
jgi:hypothetical protein